MGLLNKTDILIPKNVENEKWSVVACDQYTSEKNYWNRVAKFVGDAPSTLKLVYPEAFLEEGDARIEKINAEMKKYLEEGIFEELKSCLVYTERTLSGGRVRKGIIGAVDLEEYDFSKGSKSRIRATEGTVAERIPPRVKIRENAPLELPHVIILINDGENDIIPNKAEGELIYDFSLMEQGGHLKGYKLSSDASDKIIEKINKYASSAKDNLAFAVGDGNHSLATAKTCWENIKKGLSEEEIKNHPARYCLAEIENIYDEALEFEPIHRVLFDVEPYEVIEELKKFYPESKDGHKIEFVYEDKKTEVIIEKSVADLAVGAIQKFIDEFGYSVDYIHGDDTVKELSKEKGRLGIILPKPSKGDLFESVINDGALPRKTFSMGEANEKRFYFEAKKIK